MKRLIFILLIVFSCGKEKKEEIHTLKKDTLKTDNINSKAEINKSKMINDNTHLFNNLDSRQVIIDGWIKVGLSDKEIISKFGSNYEIISDEYSQTSGYYEQGWFYKDKGIKFLMESESQNSAKNVIEISILKPSMLKTTKNIGIGSTRKEIYDAYSDFINSKDSSEESIVIGSIYEGLFFIMKNDKVEEIFIGALAE
jgi:hypothetical protein